MSLKGKVAVITGASSGLGKATTLILEKEGALTFALARSIENTDLPGSVTKIPLNIRDLASIDNAFAKIDKKVKHIDFLVNCAGRALTKEFEKVTREEIMDVFGINLKGNIYVAQEVYKRMLPQKSGHIVNVISTSGLKAREMETIYCASKWGLRGFTESLALAAHPHGIRVTGFYPGGMRSENFWKDTNNKEWEKYMEPTLIAEQIVNLLKTDSSMSPTQVVIERN